MESTEDVMAELQAIVDAQGGKPITACQLPDGSTVFQDGSVLQRAEVKVDSDKTSPCNSDGELIMTVKVKYGNTGGIAEIHARYFAALHRENGADADVPYGPLLPLIEDALKEEA